jgi:hypothetical protein
MMDMWSAFSSLGVVGIVSVTSIAFAIAVTLGGAMVNLPYEYTLARIFYAFGFSILLFRIGYWLAFEQPEGESWILRLVFTAIIFAAIGVLWVGSIIWVSEREHRQIAQIKEPLSKEAKLPPTTAELEQNLREQIQFLRLSCEYFDKGIESEGKRIASSLHILFVDTKDSPSLLKQMRIRDEIQLLNTASSDVKGNLIPYTGLVGIHVKGQQSSYIAKCLMPGKRLPTETSPFEKWWQMVILDNHAGVIFTRASLVTAVAEQDGGIAVASGLDPSYVELARKHAMGWKNISDNKTLPSVELHSIREIAWELMEAISKQYPQYLPK